MSRANRRTGTAKPPRQWSGSSAPSSRPPIIGSFRRSLFRQADAMSTSRTPPDTRFREPAGFHPGDRVTVVDGTFTGMEGTVAESSRHARYGLVLVILPLFDHPTPV